MHEIQPNRKHVVVIGAGALGGWTALRLHEAGCKVTLLDRHGPGHVCSSSGGETRVIRAVYGQGGFYTAMIRQCLSDWKNLARWSGLDLYDQRGVLWLHSDTGEYLSDSIPHLEEAGFVFQNLSLDQVASRFPICQRDGLKGAFFEPEAGVLRARTACRALWQICGQKGVDCQLWGARPGAFSGGRLQNLVLGDGRVLEADAFIFACGPWLGALFPEVLKPFLSVSRQEVCFFKLPEGQHERVWRQLPVWIEFGDSIYYGLPEIAAEGLKVAIDERGAPMDPDRDDRNVSPESIARIRAFLELRFPDLAQSALVATKVCQYTNTPDGELLFDRHPEWRNAWFLGGGSGHAFKLAPAVASKVVPIILDQGNPVARWQMQGRVNGRGIKTQFE